MTGAGTRRRGPALGRTRTDAPMWPRGQVKKAHGYPEHNFTPAIKTLQLSIGSVGMALLGAENNCSRGPITRTSGSQFGGQTAAWDVEANSMEDARYGSPNTSFGDFFLDGSQPAGIICKLERPSSSIFWGRTTFRRSPRRGKPNELQHGFETNLSAHAMHLRFFRVGDQQ